MQKRIPLEIKLIVLNPITECQISTMSQISPLPRITTTYASKSSTVAGWIYIADATCMMFQDRGMYEEQKCLHVSNADI